MSRAANAKRIAVLQQAQRPTVESLESRIQLAASLAIPGASNVTDMVLDPTRNIIYASCSDGKIVRWDVTNQQALSSFVVPGDPGSGGKAWMSGIDITPDGNYAYATENFRRGTTGGTIYKIDLNSGAVTNLHYTISLSYDVGPADIVIMSNGKAFFTSDVTSGSSSTIPVRQIDLATDTFTSRADMLAPGNSTFARTSDRNSATVSFGTTSSGTVVRYDALTDSSATRTNTLTTNSPRHPAVSRDNSLFAVKTSGVTSTRIYSSSFTLVRTLSAGDGGFVFDPLLDRLYTLGSNSFNVYNTSTWASVGSGTIPLFMSTSDSGVAITSGDGRYIYTRGTDGSLIQLGIYDPSATLPTSYAAAEGASVMMTPSINAGIGDTATYFEWDIDYDGTFDPDYQSISTGQLNLNTTGLNGTAAHPVAFRVTTAAGRTAMATTTLNITDVAPILGVWGDATAHQGQPYTLHLAASDPGPDPILSWEINWGDGNIQTVTGNPSTVQHVYTARDTTSLITATATNQDGTFQAPTWAGARDLSFGTYGVRTYDFNDNYEQATASARQPDGKIILAGSGVTAQTSITIVRVNADGTLDSTFGNNGLVTVNLGGGYPYVSRVRLQPDGKIVLFGDFDSTVTTYYTLAVIRLNSNGSLDSTFGTGGIVNATFNTFIDQRARGLEILPDGKMMASAQVSTPAAQIGVLRLNSNGTFDTTFNSTGKVVTDFYGTADYVSDIAVQADGKAIVSGNALTDMVAARYNVDGTLDATFGTAGRATVTFPSYYAGTSGVQVQPDGKILLLGDVHNTSYTTQHRALARLNPNGTLDTTFGTAGQTITTFAYKSTSSGWWTDTDGSLVVASSYHGTTEDVVMLSRYSASGVPDISFGIGGKTTDYLPGDYVWVSGVLGDGADGLMVIGTASPASTMDFMLVRYHASPAQVRVLYPIPSLSVSGAASTTVATPYLLNIAASGPGSETITSWTVDWGDGAVQDYPAGTTQPSHTYTDGTYTRTIQVSATNPDGTFAADPVEVLVVGFNDAPIITPGDLVLSSASVNERATLTLSGSFADPDAGDLHTVTIDWGDGTSSAIVNLPAGTVTFAADHQYLDDQPSGTSQDSYTITVTVDDGEDSDSAATSVNVLNVAPQVWLDPTNPAFSNPGRAVSLQASVSEPGSPDTLSGSWTIFDAFHVVAQGAGTSITFTAPPEGTYTARFTGSDDDLGSTVRDMVFRSLYVQPTVYVSGSYFGLEGWNYTLNLSATPAGLDPIQYWTVNWGDGTVQNYSGNPSSVQHVYADGPNNYVINASATDSHGTWPAPAQGTGLDTTFGAGGYAAGSLEVPFTPSHIDMAIQPDGKIIAVASAAGADFGIQRFNADGTLDTSFGTGSIAKLDLGYASKGIAQTVVVQPDGKILVGGITRTPYYTWTIARFDANGQLDTTFATNGIALNPPGRPSSVLLQDMAITPSGKLVAAGEHLGDILVVQYTLDGQIDTSFGTDGQVVVPTERTGRDVIDSLSVLPSGKIVLAANSGNSMFVVQLLSNGTLDTTFASTGLTSVPFDVTSWAVSVTPDTAGRLLVLGSLYDSGYNPFMAMARLNANGSLDTSFGTDGKLDLRPFSGVAAKVIVQPDGRILAVGALSNGSNATDLAVVRFDPDGDLDGTFGQSGRLTLPPWASKFETAFDAHLLPNGQLLILGNYSTDTRVIRANVAPPKEVAVYNFAPSAVFQHQGGVYEGSPVLYEFQSVTDVPADVAAGFRYSYDFDGDGTWDILDSTSPSASPVYMDEGTYYAIARVCDKDGGDATAYFDTLIRNAAPTLTLPTTLLAAAGIDIARVGSFADPGADLWAGTVDFGDGAGEQPLTLAADKTFTLNHAYSSAGNYAITVTVNDGDGGIAIRTIDVTVDGTLPAVSSIVINDGNPQRSMIRQITITFSEDVTLAGSDILLRTRSGQEIAGVHVVPTQLDARTWRLEFTGTSVTGNSLPDGMYRLAISAAAVHDLAGNPLSADYSYVFHRLFGDADGDRDVDNADLLRFRQALNKPAAYTDMFDYNDDDSIDAADYQAFKARLRPRLI